MATAALPLSGLAARDAYRYRYIIAVTVALASMMELVDISIVNVATKTVSGEMNTGTFDPTPTVIRNGNGPMRRHCVTSAKPAL